MEASVSSVPYNLLKGFTIVYDNRQPNDSNSIPIEDTPLCPFSDHDLDHLHAIDQSEIQHRLNVGLSRTEKSGRILDPPRGGELSYISTVMRSSLKQRNIEKNFIQNIPQQVFKSFYTTVTPSVRDFLGILLQILGNQGAEALYNCLIAEKFPANMLYNMITCMHKEETPHYVSLLVNICSNFLLTNTVSLTLLESARLLYLRALRDSSNAFLAQNKGLLHDANNFSPPSAANKLMSVKNLDGFYRVEASINKYYAQKLLDCVFGPLSNPFLGSLTLSTIGGSMYTFHKPKFDNSLAVFSVTIGLRNGVLSDPINQPPVYSYCKTLPPSLYVDPDEASGNPVSKSEADQDHSNISMSNLYAYSGRFFVVEHTEPFSLCVCLPGMAYRLTIFYSLPERLTDIGAMHILKSIANDYYACGPSAYIGSRCFTSPEVAGADCCLENHERAAGMQLGASAAGDTSGTTFADMPAYSHDETDESKQKARFYLFPPISRSQLFEMDSQDRSIPFIHPITKTIVSKLTSTITPHLVGPHGYAQCCFYGQKNRFLLVKDRRNIVTQDSVMQYAVSTVNNGASTLQLRSTRWVLRELPTVCLLGQLFPAPTFTVQHNKSGMRDSQRIKDMPKRVGPDGIDEDLFSFAQEPTPKRLYDMEMQQRDTMSLVSDLTQSYITDAKSLTVTQFSQSTLDPRDRPSTGDNVYFVLGPENVKRITKHRIGYFITRFNMESSLFKSGVQDKMPLQSAILTRYKDLVGVFAAESFFKDMADSTKGDKPAKNDEFCTGLVSETHIFYILLLENFLSSGAFVDSFLTKCRADYYLMQVAKLTAENSAANLFLIDRFLGWSQMALCLLTNFRVSYMHKIRENKEFQTYSYVDENSYQSFGTRNLKFGCFTSLLSKFSEQTDSVPRHDLLFKNRLHIFPFSLREDQSEPLLNGIYSVIVDQCVNSRILYPYKKLHASAFPKIGLFTRPFLNRNKTQKKEKLRSGSTDMLKEDEQEQRIFEIMSKVFELEDQPDIHGTNCNAALLPKTRQKASAPDDLRIHIEKFGLCSREIEFCMSRSPQDLRRLPLDKFNVVSTGTLSKILEENSMVHQDSRIPSISNTNVEGLPTRIRKAFKEHLHPVKVILSMTENKGQKIAPGQIPQGGMDRSDKNNTLWSTYMQKIIELIDVMDIRDILTTEQHNIIHIHALRAMDNKNQEKLAAARYKLKRATMFLTGETILSSQNMGADAMTYKNCPFLSKKVLKDAGADRIEKIISKYTNAITEHVFPNGITKPIDQKYVFSEKLIASFNNYSNYSSITLKPSVIFSCLSDDPHSIPEDVIYDFSHKKDHIGTAYPFHSFYPVKQGRTGLSDDGVKSLIKSSIQRWTDDERNAMCEMSKVIRPIGNRSTSFSLRIINPRGHVTLKDKCLVLDSSAQAKNSKPKAGTVGRARQRIKGGKEGDASNVAATTAAAASTSPDDASQAGSSTSTKEKKNRCTKEYIQEEPPTEPTKSLIFVDSIEMNDYTIHDQMKEYWDPRKCLFGIARLFEQVTRKPTLVYSVSRDYQDRMVNATIYPYEGIFGQDGKCFLSKRGDEILHCSSIIADMSIVSDYTRGNMNLALANNLKKSYEENTPLFIISKKDALDTQLKRMLEIYKESTSVTVTESKLVPYSSLIRESFLTVRTIYIEFYSYPGFSLDTMRYGIPPVLTTQYKPQYNHRTVTIPKLPPRDVLNNSFFANAIAYISTVYTTNGNKIRGINNKSIFSLPKGKISYYITELDRCSEEFWPNAPAIHRLLICENALAEEKWLMDQKSTRNIEPKVFYTLILKNKSELLANGKLQLNTLETSIDFPSEIIDSLRFSQEMRKDAEDRLQSFIEEIATLKCKHDSMNGLSYWFNTECFTDSKEYNRYKKFIEVPKFLKDIQAHISKSRVRECLFKCAIDIVQDTHRMVLNAIQYNLTEPAYSDSPISRINTEEDLERFISLDSAKNAIVLWYIVELMKALRRFYRVNFQPFALLGVSWVWSNFYDAASGAQASPGKTKAAILGAYYHIMRYYIQPYDFLLKDDYVRLGRKQQKMRRKMLDSE